jgi:hypothetical protein
VSDEEDARTNVDGKTVDSSTAVTAALDRNEANAAGIFFSFPKRQRQPESAAAFAVFRYICAVLIEKRMEFYILNKFFAFS